VSDYEGEEDETTEVLRQANWRWSWWDIAGWGVSVTGGMFGCVAQGLGRVSLEFFAAGAWTRDRKDRDEYVAAYELEQRRMSEELERQVGLDSYWLSDATKPEDLR